MITESLNFFRFSVTVGDSYISPSIVGQIKIGERAARTVLVSILSEIPEAILERVFAVQGAITKRSAHSPR